MNSRLYNHSETFPSSKWIVVKYLYGCNALYNRRLTLIAMIKLNSGQTELNQSKTEALIVPLTKLVTSIKAVRRKTQGFCYMNFLNNPERNFID